MFLDAKVGILPALEKKVGRMAGFTAKLRGADPSPTATSHLASRTIIPWHYSALNVANSTMCVSVYGRPAQQGSILCGE